MICVFNFLCPFTFTYRYFVCFSIAATQMTRSDVTIRSWNTCPRQQPLQWPTTWSSASLTHGLDVSLLCQFATWTFRYHLRRFATWTLRYLDGSLPGRFATWTFRYLDVSHPWTLRYLDGSLPGRFATWTFRYLDVSHPWTFRYLDVLLPP